MVVAFREARNEAASGMRTDIGGQREKELNIRNFRKCFFAPQITQMDTDFSHTDFGSLDGSCHAGCFVHQPSLLAMTIIRAIRKICVRKTHDKTEHLRSSV